MSTLLPPRCEAAGRHLTPPRTARALVVARWPVGGIRTHLNYNAPALTEAGYRCTFVVPADDGAAAFRATFGRLPGVEIVEVPVRKRRCPLWSAARRQLRTGRFDLLHSHGLTAAVHAAGANLGLGVPHVATAHDVLRPEQFVGLKGRLKRRLLGRIIARVDRVVCVSNDVRDNLFDYLPAVRRERALVIPNGIDAERYRGAIPVKEDLRARLRLSPQTALIGFLGRFMEQKGFLPLLGALQRLVREGPPRPFHLLAVGSADRRREYAAEVGRRGLAGHVTILDFVPDALPVLAQLDLLVVPSLWEASSLLSMEAMAAGLPVLGSDCVGLREVLRGTPSRLTRAGDEADLCRGLREALAEPWTMEAREFAAEACDRFDNAHGARRLLDLYADLLRGAKA